MQVGAAVLGVAVKPTIKQVDQQGQVVKTLQRASLWEVQTPQVCLSLSQKTGAAGALSGSLICSIEANLTKGVGGSLIAVCGNLPEGAASDAAALKTRRLQVIRPKLLLKGFEHVAANNLAVTDDVSIVEAMGLPVKVTPGSYTNIKVGYSSIPPPVVPTAEGPCACSVCCPVHLTCCP